MPPISKCLMTLMTNDLNDHPLFSLPSTFSSSLHLHPSSRSFIFMSR